MKAIVVVDACWGIGKNNGLLFHLPLDMRNFREKTLGKVVVMGANTFASLPGGALKNRTNVVLDASGAQHEGTISVATLGELDQLLTNYDSDDVFVIGGASVYRLLLDRCNVAYVTKVDEVAEADVFFPNLDALPDWKTAEIGEKLFDNGHAIRFVRYERF